MHKLPQLSGYAIYFGDNSKCMIFLIHNKKLSKAYNAIWVKAGYLIKEFNSERVYNNKYIGTKRRSYNDTINTIFHGNKKGWVKSCIRKHLNVNMM